MLCVSFASCTGWLLNYTKMPMPLSPISRADRQSLALGSVFAELQVRGRTTTGIVRNGCQGVQLISAPAVHSIDERFYAMCQLRFLPKVERSGSKLYKDADAAVADIKSGSTILSSGFGP
jgi:hypothetical protein